jgi:hypothetical protein
LLLQVRGSGWPAPSREASIAHELAELVVSTTINKKTISYLNTWAFNVAKYNCSIQINPKKNSM